MEVVVPDIGDFSDVEVVEVLVSAGDKVAAEDPLIVLETDKASLEVPSTHAGVITELKVKTGDRVSAGDAIAELDAADDEDSKPDEAAADAQSDEATSDSAEAADTAPAEADETGQDEPEQPPSGEPESVTISVPDIGDFSDVEIVEVLVAAGDSVAVDDPLIVLESDKATLEIPSTRTGEVTELKVKAGDRVSAGDAILELEAQPEPQAQAKPEPRPADADEAERAAKPERSAAEPSRAERPRQAAPRAIDEAGFSKAHASPSVRKLARELGVDLVAVEGSGRKGRVTADDLKAHVKNIMQGGAAQPALPRVPEVDFASFGDVETKPLSRIQKISGPRLHASWVNVPHVTQHDEADITELEELRRELKSQAAEQDIHLTPLAFIMRAVIVALGEFPMLRSSLSADGEALVVKNYYHIGFAVDTEQGLVVPVVRDADRLNLFGIAHALGELSEKARAGKLSTKDIQGGVFSISSLGSIGGTFFTPIINAPEVAILGVARSKLRPVYDDGALVPRLMLPLSLSYDHRVVDGAMAVRFTTRLVELLEQGRKLSEIAP